MESKEETRICCICGKPFTGFAYNPYPVRKSGVCCPSCNCIEVVPARLREMCEKQHGGKKR